MRRAGCSALLIPLVLATLWSYGFAQSTCTEVYGSGNRTFSVATGSPGELGLLKALGEAFAKVAGASLCWITEDQKIT